jgi:hypothetical protein
MKLEGRRWLDWSGLTQHPFFSYNKDLFLIKMLNYCTHFQEHTPPNMSHLRVYYDGKERIVALLVGDLADAIKELVKDER